MYVIKLYKVYFIWRLIEYFVNSYLSVVYEGIIIYYGKWWFYYLLIVFVFNFLMYG